MESETDSTTSEFHILRHGTLLSRSEPVPRLYPGASTYHGAGEDSCLPPDICARVIGEDFAHEAPYHIDGALKGDSLEAPL